MKTMNIMLSRATLLFALAAIVLAALSTVHNVEAAPSSGNIVDNRVISATIDPATSIATLKGVIQCSTETQLTVYGWATQIRKSLRPVQSYGGTYVACGTTPTAYVVTLTPGYESGRLVPGGASVGFWAEYCADGQCYGHNTERELRLVPTR